jgi:hypothetical protein
VVKSHFLVLSLVFVGLLFPLPSAAFYSGSSPVAKRMAVGDARWRSFRGVPVVMGGSVECVEAVECFYAEGVIVG